MNIALAECGTVGEWELGSAKASMKNHPMAAAPHSQALLDEQGAIKYAGRPCKNNVRDESGDESGCSLTKQAGRARKTRETKGRRRCPLSRLCLRRWQTSVTIEWRWKTEQKRGVGPGRLQGKFEFVAK